MAITVSHQPSMALMAQTAYFNGAGEAYRRNQDMAQQERMQMRALQANHINQQMAAQNSLNRMAFGAGIDARQQEAAMAGRMQMQEQEQEWQKQLKELQMQDAQDRMQTEFKNRQMMEILKNDNAMHVDFNEHLLGKSFDRMEEIEALLADGMDFATKEGRKRYEQAQVENDRLANDPTLTPSAKAQGIYHQTSQIPVPTVRVQTLQQAVKEDVVWQDMKMPNGKSVKVAWTRDHNGAMRLSGTFEADAEPQTIAQQVAADVNDMVKVRAQAVRELQSKNEDGSVKVPTDAEIKQRMQEIIAEQQGAPQEKSKGGPKKVTYDPATDTFK